MYLDLSKQSTIRNGGSIMMGKERAMELAKDLFGGAPRATSRLNLRGSLPNSFS